MHVSVLNHRHREIARRILLGEKQRDIALSLGMSESQVSIIVRSPIFKRMLDRMQDELDKKAFDVIDHMREHSEKAAKVITNTLDDPDAPLALRKAAANDVLKYAGYRQQPGSRIINYGNMTFEQRLSEIDRQDAQTDTKQESEEQLALEGECLAN